MSNKKIVVLGPTEGPLQKLESVLSRSSLQVQRVELAQDAIAACETVPTKLLLASLPLADEPFAEFLSKIRSSLPPSRQPTVAILAEQPHLPDLQGISENNLVVMDAGRRPQQLQKDLLGHLGVAARVAERFLIRLQVHLTEGDLPRLCQTENVSEIGMLVRTIELFPVGTEVDFEISIPGQQRPVRGRAEIVRHASPENEKVRGFGARFTSFAADGHQLLKTCLAQRKA